MRAFRTLVVALAAAVAVLFGATPAQAHDELVTSTPAAGSTVKTMPERATLVFSETVEPEDVAVKVGKVKLAVAPDPRNPSAVIVDLRKVPTARTVVLSWAAVDSHDGHASSGEVTFKVRAGAAAATTAGSDAAVPASVDDDSGSIDLLQDFGRVLGYLAMAVFVGGLVFISLLWPAGASVRRAQILLGTAVGAGIVSAGIAVLVVLLRTDDTLARALAEDFGRENAAMALLWLLASIVLAGMLQRGEIVRELPWRVGALVVAAGLLRATGMNAHATQTSDPGWGTAAEFLHMIGVSAWIGGLAMLSVCLLPRRDQAELEAVIPRFSRIAMVSVLLILASGAILLWQIIGTVDGFWGTHYANVLIIKLSIFAVVMLAAMKSRHWVEQGLKHAVASHRTSAVRSLSASVATETVLVIAVLGAASVLVTSSPGI